MPRKRKPPIGPMKDTLFSEEINTTVFDKLTKPISSRKPRSTAKRKPKKS